MGHKNDPIMYKYTDSGEKEEKSRALLLLWIWYIT
jgi:hypothetical protein